jgi:uncharacterized membrane protein YqgA involved in biofilm formation
MRGLGTVVNVATVLAGTALGLLLGRRLPERVRATVLSGVGLVVLVIGFDEARVTRNVIFPLVAIVLGGLMGELVDIEGRLERLGERLRSRVAQGAQHDRFVEGFVTASLVFCVGPLTVLGSVQDGLHADHQLLFVKAGLDGLVALILASTLGWGVGLSAVVIAVFQGVLTAFAVVVDRVLTDRMVLEMTATGGVMVIGIGVRVLELRAVRVASFLPALVIAPVAVGLFAR